MNGRGGRSIEEIYQASKVFQDGRTNLSWRDAKGKYAVNQEEVNKLYGELWDEYMVENPHLIDVLIQASGVSDIFGQKGHACQATELWRIRNAALGIIEEPLAPQSKPNQQLSLF